MFKSLLPILLALTTLPAWGTTQFYIGDANEAAFNSAAGALTYFNFSGATGLPATAFLDLNTSINFAAFTSNGANAANLTLSGTRLSQTSGSGGDQSTILLDLPGTVQIIGLHLADSTFGNFCVEAAGTPGCITAEFGVNSTPSFLGIISSGTLADFQIRHTDSGSSNLLRIVDVAVSSGTATSSEAPEPSTLALVGSGLVLFPLIARRKRRG